MNVSGDISTSVDITVRDLGVTFDRHAEWVLAGGLLLPISAHEVCAAQVITL